MEKEIELINEIIANAIIHGGDWGGPYESNLENLVIAVNNWLREKGLKDRYHVIEASYTQTLTTGFKFLPNYPECGDSKTSGQFPVLKIVPRGEENTGHLFYHNLDCIP